MNSDNVCVLGAKGNAGYYSVHQVRVMEKEKQKSGIRCFFGDKELFTSNCMCGILC